MKIINVDDRSPAQRAGIVVGDEIVSVSGHPIRDVLDYKYYTYERNLEIVLDRGGETCTVQVKKQEGEDLGLDFETYIMDKARSCANNCVFCFIDQLPQGMRDSLYFKDDDLRLSFLLGNYITLTNLSDRDIARIIEMRISPINISVHVTDPELRIKMLGNRRAGRCFELMQRFADARIMMNCQIVCCPGWNDGAVLTQTLEDLKSLFPAVSSVSVVPVGLTGHRAHLCHLEPVDVHKAWDIIQIVTKVGNRCVEEFGTRVFYCGDELYLKAGLPIPDFDHYEDFPQIENGVGMMASMEEEVRRAVESLEENNEKMHFSVATGTAAAPFMERMLDLLAQKCHNIEYTVYPIENRFFGGGVDVAGLVTGGDIIDQLKGKSLGDRLLITKCMLRAGEDVFLDDIHIADVERALNVRVVPVENDGFVFTDAVLHA